MFRRIMYRLTSVMLVLCSITCQSYGISTSAGSAIVIEQDSGRVIYEQNADEERLIASITKIMTAVVAIEYGELETVYTVTKDDMAEGSSMYLQPGDQLTLEELLYGLLLVSGNDAALAVAHCVSKDIDRFVLLMNKTAQKLGMSSTSFANPNGLDADGHYSSARDMARLAAYALNNPVFVRIASTESAVIGGRQMTNHNKLLSICEGCIGVKTGYTKAAGRTLVSAVRRNGMTLVCVTLKDSDDWADHISLYEYAFSSLRMQTLAYAGEKLASVTVVNGTKRTVMLAAVDDISYPVFGNEHLTMKIEVPVSVAAPVMSGQVVGTAYVCLEGQEVASIDLIAISSVPENTSPGGDNLLFKLFHKSEG